MDQHRRLLRRRVPRRPRGVRRRPRGAILHSGHQLHPPRGHHGGQIPKGGHGCIFKEDAGQFVEDWHGAVGKGTGWVKWQEEEEEDKEKLSSEIKID